MSSETNTREREHEDRSWSRLTTIVLTVAVVASTFAVAPVAAQEDTTFIVEQGGQCIQITPLGDGTQSVEAFYDYRSPVMDQEGLYSSYGTTDIQQSQTSQLFVYRGSEGVSLVFLHDEFGDEMGGFAATADISGLPVEGEWVVEDDTYNNREDVFAYSNGSAHIEWASNGNRTDGAAFRGLRSPNYTTITVDMQFNEESNRYPYEEWEGSPEQNEIERWVVRSGTGETTELDMSEPVQISPGTCSGGVSTFTATPAGSNTTTAGGSNATTTSAGTETTTASTAVPTATTTATATQTQTATPATTAATTPASMNGTTNATTSATGTGGLVGTTEQPGDGGGSGAFGPGFGVGLALVAIVALAALVRRAS